MDQSDIRLLHALAKDADVTATKLMDKVNLSIPAVNKRIARLKESGTIRNVTILTNPDKVGKSVIAFVLVVLDRFSNMDTILKGVEADRDVLECYAVTGEYDYLLKICAPDIATLENKLLRLKEKGISRSHTMLALCEHKYAPTVLPDLEDGR